MAIVHRLFGDIQELLRRPNLFERTAEPFWDDPHIAPQMLTAHLDPSTDAASRKPDFIDRSVDWIVSLGLSQSASLLDLGCGPGLYASRFAERGIHVTGLDISANSLDYARRHDPVSSYINQSYLDMDFDSMFDMAVMIWCDYGALIPTERQNLLRRVRKALKPAGLFLFDVFTPKQQSPETASWQVNTEGGFWSEEPHLVFDATYGYDGVAECRRTVVVTDTATHQYNIWDSFFTTQQLQAELKVAGFAHPRLFSDVAGADYDEQSATICAVTTPATANT